MEKQYKTSEWIDMLSDNLLSNNDSRLSFTDFDDCRDETENLLGVYKTKRNLGARNLCAVYDLTEEIATFNDLSHLFRQIRTRLTKRYAKFPYWKELGTFSIILCDNTRYEKFSKEIKRLKDNSGFHMNTMLGTFLVNVDKYEFTETKTWGLICSGKQYELIKQTLLKWMSLNKNKP